ncbi:glycosyltransferase family 2 protein [Dictyobacter kobayashii]|uniref:Glycosyl transferase n=1 Tax=Dictyobacter kobayashii TaxID=2014872 RepID=A0A402ABX2_9CHLR|nr:glycosyltransferase family 2 protein [Dictyobacter kobayashii]GCE16597.1 glycosyl transferase [Dictyobacter kobayashii]
MRETIVKKNNDIRSKYLSVIIPVYNEEESVPHLHKRVNAVLSTQQFSYEVLYIDDGSTDGTLQQLSQLVEKDEHVRVISFRRNFGQTAAMAAGVAHSQGEILIFMDGDLQNDPVDIPRLLKKIDEGYDVVSGWRKNRQDAQWSRKFPSQLANKLISRVTGVELHDYGCTLKAYRYEVLRHVRLYGEMHRFIPAYAALSGAKITEMVVDHHARQFGKSKYGISRVVRVILDLTTLKFLGSFGTKPLYAFGITGLSALGLGFGSGLYSLLRSFVPTRDKHQRTAIFPTSLLFSSFGLLCLVSGLIAEMLTRIYYESQDKPTYVVKQIQPESSQHIQLVDENLQTPKPSQKNGKQESTSSR